MKLERHIEVQDEQTTAVDLLAESTTLSKGAIKQAMNKGAVWLTHDGGTRRIRRAGRKLNDGDILHLYYDPAILQQQPKPALLIADEGTYSVWFKPGGMLSQGSKWSDHCTINRWVERSLEPQRPAFIVNRLDRAACGLMLIAHSKGTAAELSRLFRERRIEKRYRVLVAGRFPDQAILDQALDERPALSHVQRLAYDRQHDQSLLEVTIETGRKHQIRRHLAGAGYPVIGDRLYGRHRQTDRDLQLTSARLAFDVPGSTERRCYTAPDALLPDLD